MAARPDRDGDWQVTTVTRRTTNRNGSKVCAATGKTVPLDEPHFYVSLRRPTRSPVRPDESDHLVVAADALDELDAWLEEE